MTPDAVWLPAIAAAACSIPASVLAGVIISMVRRTLAASRGAETAAGQASAHAQAAAGSAGATALDVTSLQGRLRAIDSDLGELREGVSERLALRLEVDTMKRDLGRVLEFMATIERENHAQGMGRGSV